MSYQQGNRPGAPYPQQGYPPPTGGAPYPSNPPYHPNPNTFGYNSNAPMQMPQPMRIPTYPASAPPASNNSPYPASGGGYPPSSGGPPSSSPYQPSSAYPPASGGSYPPPSSSGYPPQSGGYPPQSGGGGYPPQSGGGGYPPQSGGYPPQSGGYPPQSGGYPPQSGGYPPQSGGYPPSSGGYPPSPHRPAPGAAPAGHGYQGPKGPHGGVSYTASSAHSLQSQSHRPKRTPTVVPAGNFNPRSDAEILRKAMKGFGTDEKAIINVLAHRSNAQRLQIAFEFKTLYGKDLIKDLKSETSGNFENLLVAMMTPLPEYYAKELHDAMQGLGTEENVLIEILCTKSNEEIMVIRQAYNALYYRPLEDDIIGDTGGTFKRLMVSLCNAARDESMMVNPDAARADAQALLRAGELKLGTDESTFNAVLCQRNWAQLQLVFREYENLTGHDIETAIKNEFSGDAEEGLLAVVRSIKNQSAFFAKYLNKSMKGLGTNDRDLIRLVVTRSEIDMVEVKNEYQAKYGESLAEAIKGDCSGDYKRCLLHLIGEA